MLKSQPRSSPVATSISPRFHPYQNGNSPSRTSLLIAPQRTSPAVGPFYSPPPPRKVIHYADRGTQWSPMVLKMKEPPLGDVPPVNIENSSAAKADPPQPENIPPTTITPSPPKALTPGESPSTKKREPPEQIPLASGSQAGALPSRNVRPRQAQARVKILPLAYELCDVEDIVILIANMISELIERNDLLPVKQDGLTRFHSRTPPGISVLDYLQRLAKHATLTPPLLLAMVFYIDRLCLVYPAFTMTTLTVHRFLITAATVAAKGLSDSFWNNATYARVGGIKIAELGLLELDFLYRVDWKIVPNPEVLVDYYKGLVKRSEGYELGQSSSLSDDENDDDDDYMASDEKEMVESPESSKTEEVAEKWQSWMDDVKKDDIKPTGEGSS